MEDIYDRTVWPPPESNPLVRMLQRGDEWYSNREVVDALGLEKHRGLMQKRTILVRQLLDEDTGFLVDGTVQLGREQKLGFFGQRRMLNRRALIIAAMRTNTVNAAAFRDWLATKVAGEVSNGKA